MRLTSKTILPVGLILLITGSLIVVLFWYYLEGQMLNDFFVSHSDKVARNAERFLVSDDFNRPKDSLSVQHFNIFFQVLDVEEITNVIIWSASGQIVASKATLPIGFNQSEEGAIISHIIEMKSPVFLKHIGTNNETKSTLSETFPYEYEIFVPLFINGELNGIVELHLSDMFISQIIKKIVFIAAMLFILASLAVFGAIIYFLHYFIISPLNQLSGASKALRLGNWDVSFAVKNKKDEIEDLAFSFGHMRSSLKDSFEKIERKEQSAKKAEKIAQGMSNSLEAERDRGEGILRYLHSIKEGIIAIDQKGSLSFINLTAARMISKTENSPLLGKKYSTELSFYREYEIDKKKIDPVSLAISHHGTYVLPQKCFLCTPNGDIPVAGSFSAIMKDGKNMGVVGIFQNITERLSIEREKDDFLSIAAHQLRTPLSGIRWVIEFLLEGDAGKLSKEANELLTQIFNNNQRLIELVNDLLDVSRINMGKSKEETSLVNICQLLSDAVKALEGLARDRKITIHYEEVCALTPNIEAGPKHIFQAFENIISNAIKYTEAGGRVDVLAKFKKNKVIVSVKDNGIGIPKQEQSKIFSKFFRSTNAVLKEANGSGLGLNVVKSFIEEANGKVWFESEEGKGSEFFVELPLLNQIKKENIILIK